MNRKKPLPFHQISAFDAAMRHLSFSRAARELNVLQPAVSRQVAALEEALGTALFVRTKPNLTPTKDGELLALRISKGLDLIRRGLGELSNQNTSGGIVVNAAIGFTSLYLLPRMAEFQALHPDIKVQIVTRDQNPDYDMTHCDVVVHFGSEGLFSLPSRKIFSEKLVAICHPDYLSTRLLELGKLSGERLLHMTSSDHANDWERYFFESDIELENPKENEKFHSYMVYLRAIQSGLGIGLGWRPMIDEYLAAGTLMLACSHEITTERGYFCSLTPRGAAKSESEIFLSWIGTES